jgi:anti-anti-sigma factor
MPSIIKVIQPAGILDSTNGNRLRRDVNDAIESGAAAILIDCQDVLFMDSSGLSALIMILKAVREANRKLSLCSINDQLRMLFELTSMESVFEVFQNQAEFNRLMSVSHSLPQL